MAHSIEEARVMTSFAREKGLVSSMGTWAWGRGLRQIKEWIEMLGQFGKVCRCWVDGFGPAIAGEPGHKWWLSRQDLPTRWNGAGGSGWDLWIGAAKERPYHKVYHPHDWRAFFDFGTGALGDMSVHNLDPAWYALENLGSPVRLRRRAGLWGRIVIRPGRSSRLICGQGRAAGGECEMV